MCIWFPGVLSQAGKPENGDLAMTGFRSGFGMIIYILIFCGLVLEKKQLGLEM